MDSLENTVESSLKIKEYDFRGRYSWKVYTSTSSGFGALACTSVSGEQERDHRTANTSEKTKGQCDVFL